MAQRQQQALTVPQRVEDLPQFLSQILPNILTRLRGIEEAFFELTYVAPVKPVEGMIRYADGTQWNPGAGAGLYQYRSGVWTSITTSPDTWDIP